LSIKIAARLMAGLALAGVFTSLSSAQQTTQPSSPDSTAQPSQQTPPKGESPASPQPPQPDKGANGQDSKGDASGTSSGTSKDRLFYALPNFLSLENGGKVPPLTTKQKFAVVTRGSFDYVQIPWYAFLSGLSQAQNSEPGFGQGAAGYGKRFGSAMADGTIENYLTSAILPSLLRQDPRFFQSGKGGFARRTGYAVSRIFVTRTDSGGPQFNTSEILGSAISAAISTYSYHPRSEYVSTPTNPHKFIPSDRTLKNTASVWGTQVGYDTITIVVKEFWPDIHRKLSHKHQTDADVKTSNP
jgi:hypothetical protein